MADIIKADKSRRYVVPSAPGKRNDKDEKVTDMLYACYDAVAEGRSYKKILDKIKERYNEIIDGLDLNLNLDHEFDKIEEKRNYNEESVNRMVIAQIMEELPEKKRTLIRMRYFEERTQTDIAAKLGISQVQVSRMEKKILASMKKKLA